MPIRRHIAIVLVLIAPIIPGCARTHDADSDHSSRITDSEKTVTIAQIDWVLLNARVDLMTDTFMNRWPRVVSPPVYTSDFKGNHVTASAYIDSLWLERVHDAELQQTLNDTGNVFCSEIYLPTSDSLHVQLDQNSTSCSVDFFTVASAGKNQPTSKDVATYDFQREHLTLK